MGLSSVFESFLNEGLPIRRLGVVTEAVATLWRDDDTPDAASQPESRLLPITFPTQIPMAGGWRLQHASPTSGQLVTDNALVALFHDTRYANSICLHSYNLPNLGLLDSIASVFNHLRLDDQRENGTYYYSSAFPPMSLPGTGGAPSLLYYRPQENPAEQYLLLYDERVCMYERPGDDDTPSYVNLYELVQVELDEERFVRLLRQALDEAPRIRRQCQEAYLKAYRSDAAATPLP